MTTELFKMTEETTIENSVEKKEVTQIETIIKDDNGNEIGRLHVNKWGASFNLNNGKMDVQAINEGILGLLISTEETI
jgi:hypothetical protein